jgi:hypothetical protein
MVITALLLLAGTGFATDAAHGNKPSSAPARDVVGNTHVIVNRPGPGRAFGWPANGGIWSWGNEILVMYLDCPYKDHPGFSNHDSDQEHPSAQWMTSRSTDGGATWTEHRSAFPNPRPNLAAAKPVALTAPKAGIRMNVNKSRMVLGRLATAKRNRILNNVLVRSGQPLAIADPDNVCDYNLVAKSDPPFDLAAWQAKTGWDKHSVVVELEAAFDVPTRQVTWRSLDALPCFPRVERVDWDLAGRRLEGPQVLPGPFVKEPAVPTLLLPDLKK